MTEYMALCALMQRREEGAAMHKYPPADLMTKAETIKRRSEGATYHANLMLEAQIDRFVIGKLLGGGSSDGIISPSQERALSLCGGVYSEVSP